MNTTEKAKKAVEDAVQAAQAAFEERVQLAKDAQRDDIDEAFGGIWDTLDVDDPEFSEAAALVDSEWLSALMATGLDREDAQERIIEAIRG